MTTDNGIDLVAYAPSSAYPKTIQVKTNLRAKPGGGRGRMAVDWWLEESSPAQLVALVELDGERVWLMTHAELDAAAQQRSNGRLHFYMYVDPDYQPRRPDCHVKDFLRFGLDARIESLFSSPVT